MPHELYYGPMQDPNRTLLLLSNKVSVIILLELQDIAGLTLQKFADGIQC